MLITANLLLIPCVLAWDWSVFDLVFLYWAENVVIGVINVLRMAIASPETAQPPKRVSIRGRRFPGMPGHAGAAGNAHHAFKFFIIPFFVLHYGGFCYGHGVFVMTLFDDSGASGLLPALASLTPAMMWAVGLLAASHLFSLAFNYLLGGEYRRTNAAALMIRPYGRIVALHVTILFGALLIEWLGSPLGLLIVLVAAKTAADLALHETERGKLKENH